MSVDPDDPSLASRTRVLLNPLAGRGRAASRLSRALRSCPAEVCTVEFPAAMSLEAGRAAAEGLDRVIVAGGDGAVHHAIQGLAGTSCALGIVPVGSGNDLARALGLPREPAAALRRALRGGTRSIDLGRIGGRVFAGVLGLGIDGDVCRIVQESYRGWPPSIAYALAALSAARRYEAPRLRVTWEDGVWEGPALLAALANSPVFGGGMRIAPRAALDDGWLDLVLVERVPFRVLLRALPRLYRGTLVGHPAVRAARVRRATFLAAPPRAFWADGEPVFDPGAQEAPAAVWPGALRVVA